MFGVMTTQSKMSSNSYMPFLKEADSKNISRDDFGKRLIYGDYYIESCHNSFVVKSLEDDSILSEVVISQNNNGIDVENRIEKLKSYLKDKN